MNFHEIGSVLDGYAAWMEEVAEVDWEELKRSKWWVGPADWEPPARWVKPKDYPKRLTSEMVSKLLLAQEKSGLEIPIWLRDPYEGMWEEIGKGDGWEWEEFLEKLEKVQVRPIRISLVSAEERRSLVKLAILEEAQERLKRSVNAERTARQYRHQTRLRLGRREEKWLRGRASRGMMEAIIEMERRNLCSREESERWRSNYERRVEGVKKALEVKRKKREEIESLKPGNREVEVKVIRVGPNPRIVLLRWEGVNGEERWIKFKVRDTSGYRVGQRYKFKESEVEGKEILEIGELERRERVIG
jgi:hypothetical protein